MNILFIVAFVYKLKGKFQSTRLLNGSASQLQQDQTIHLAANERKLGFWLSWNELVEPRWTQ